MKKIKSKPKLRKPTRRVRRSPYGRALDLATKRYDRAVDEYLKCQKRLSALEEEIPKLDEMKRVLEGYIDGTKAGSVPAASLTNQMPPAENPVNLPPPELPPGIADRVPAHLRRFIVPHPSILKNSQAQGGVVRANVSGDDDDRFLPNPTGVELLP